MAQLPAARGQRLGPYELGERLGQGGMAEVYIARRAGPRGFAKRFAIKRILPQLARDPHFVSMFCDEARISASLNHPNIVQVVDFGEHQGELFMAMEYVEGVSCAKLLRAVAAKGDRVPLGAALYITHEVLRALAFAHAARDDRGRPLGIVHRDVSPGNVLLGRAGEVKLTDFGIVRSDFIDRRTNPGELKGKIGYMSPEQALGHEIDLRSDLFTVAILLAEMLMARPLFPGRSEIEILSRIHDADLGVLERHAHLLPQALVGVLRRALAKKPAERFASADEFAKSLRAVARAARITLSDSELSGWLYDLGVMPGSSGLRPAVKEAAATLPRLVRAPSDRPTEPGRPPSLDAHYRLEAPEGREVGLLDVADLIELVVTGRAPATARVLQAGKPPRAIRDVAALERIVGRREYAFGSTPERAERIPLEPSALPSLLYSLAAERATGLLVVRDRRREKRIYLRAGSPVQVASTQREELLGKRLVAQGLIRSEHLGLALGDAAESGSQLGVTLVDRGFLRPAALVRALHAQVEARAIELGGWTRGELWFVRGARPVHEVVPPLRSAGVWITRLVRDRLQARSVDEALAAVGPSPVAENPNPPFDLDALGLDAEESTALAAAAGTRSLTELIGRLSASGTSPAVTRRAVFIGLSSGILVAPGWSR